MVVICIQRSKSYLRCHYWHERSNDAISLLWKIPRFIRRCYDLRAHLFVRCQKLVLSIVFIKENQLPQWYKQFMSLLHILHVHVYVTFPLIYVIVQQKLMLENWQISHWSRCTIFFIVGILENGTAVISKKITQRKQGVSTNTPMTSALTGLVSLSVLVLIAYAIQKRNGGRDKPMLDIMEMGRREKPDKCNNL